MSQLWSDIWFSGSLDAMPYHDYLPRTIESRKVPNLRLAQVLTISKAVEHLDPHRGSFKGGAFTACKSKP